MAFSLLLVSSVTNPTQGAAALLERYVERHNKALTTHEDDTKELFAEGVGVEVEGEALSPLRKEAIVYAFKSHELMLWKIGTVGENEAFASYAWRRNPRLGGVIRLVRGDDRITQLVLRPGYARVFATLSFPPGPTIDEDGPNAFAGD